MRVLVMQCVGLVTSVEWGAWLYVFRMRSVPYWCMRRSMSMARFRYGGRVSRIGETPTSAKEGDSPTLRLAV